MRGGRRGHQQEKVFFTRGNFRHDPIKDEGDGRGECQGGRPHAMSMHFVPTPGKIKAVDGISGVVR